jgi:ubiquinone/menaquinone biosynthesis C-methylase UbiE
MNYGYHNDSTVLNLKEEDENDRYNIQSYDRLVKDIDLTNKTMLEVSCGRGGGIYYYSSYFNLKNIIGLDITKQAISFCKSKYHFKNASFVLGDAQQLPFEDEIFDIIVNLEASGNYPDLISFFNEVSRTLKPGGYFAYADLRKSEEIPKWNDQIKRLSLKLVEKEDITEAVSVSLALSSKNKERLINENIPKIFRSQFYEFAGTKGSNYVYNALKKREKVYIRYLFKKP